MSAKPPTPPTASATRPSRHGNSHPPRPWYRIVVTNPTTGERLASSSRDTLAAAIRTADQWADLHTAIATVTELPSGRLVRTADPFGLQQGTTP